MNPDSVTSTLPAEPALRSLSDRRFVVGLASLGLWFDATLAVAFGTNLLEMDLVWAKEIPIGKLLLILTGYGLALTVVLPPIVAVCNRVWWWTRDTAAIRWPRFGDWYTPDRERDVDAFSLVREAAHSGNSALLTYSRQHLDDVIHDFDGKHHLMLIGIALIVEILAPASFVNRIIAAASWKIGILTLLLAVVLAAMSLFQGAKPLSLYATYLRRPDTPP